MRMYLTWRSEFSIQFKCDLYINVIGLIGKIVINVIIFCKFIFFKNKVKNNRLLTGCSNSSSKYCNVTLICNTYKI